MKAEMKKRPGSRADAEWAEARRLCRLSAEDVRKAKEISLSPRSLIQNRPSGSQSWKAPVHIWVREIYDRMIERSARKRERKAMQCVISESLPTVAHELHDSPSKHGRGAVAPHDPECIARSDLDTVNIEEPE